jgi:LPS export ABC transporter protein LptC
VKKIKLLDLPPSPLLEEVPEETSRSRWKRTFFILGVAAVLIVFLAWMLGKSNPQPNAPESVLRGENSPDSIIEKLHLISTLQGQKRWEMFADIARLYQNQKQAYADNIYCQYYKGDRIVSTLTAEKAVINTETNATEAEGHVELVVENGSKLETDKLNWDPDQYEIRTESNVRVFKGLDEITAMGLVADTQLNNIRFIRNVHTQVRDTHEIENFSQKKKF